MYHSSSLYIIVLMVKLNSVRNLLNGNAGNVLHKHISECQWTLALQAAKKDRNLIMEKFHNEDMPIHMALKLFAPDSFILFLLER